MRFHCIIIILSSHVEAFAAFASFASAAEYENGRSFDRGEKMYKKCMKKIPRQRLLPEANLFDAYTYNTVTMCIYVFTQRCMCVETISRRNRWEMFASVTAKLYSPDNLNGRYNNPLG